MWIDSSDYQWKEFPVIRLDLSTVVANNPQTIADSLQFLLKEIAEQYGIEDIEQEFPTQTLRSLVLGLFKRIGPVVILIDEYDQPLVKHFSNPSVAEANREFLSEFYANIKSLEQYLRFVFVTGVSQFTKVSLFSGMNHLKPLSLRDDYSTLLGLTEEEIITYFKPRLQAIATQRGLTLEGILSLLRTWYNGYRFFKSSGTKVYTPISVFSFLETAQLDNYWFATATPTFAIDLIKQRNFPILNPDNGIIAGDEIEIAHDVRTIDIPTLLFQTGYLTITQYDEQQQAFVLDFPNEEVRRSLGFRVESEVSTSQGRLDMLLKTKDSIFIFEFKIDKTAEEALNQILRKSYHQQFEADPRKRVLVGVNFDTKSRMINDWKIRTL